MANVYVSEHAGLVAQERQSVTAPLAVYQVSSVSTPVLPNAAANFIRVTADAAALVSWFSSSTSVTGQLTSTNAVRIAANITERFQLSRGTTVMRIMASST